MKKQINQLLKDISLITSKATSKEEAINKGQNRYLQIEHASHYGGYRLVNVNIETGGHSGAFGESSVVSRRSAKVMMGYLEGLLNGLQINTNN